MLFDKEELNQKNSEAEVITYAQEIKSKIDKKKSYLTSLATSPSILQHWDDITKRLISFEADYKTWSADYAKAIQTKMRNVITENLEDGCRLVEELKIHFENLIPNETRSSDIEQLKNQVLSEIEKNIGDLTTAIDEKIQTGINSILNLKAEIGLAGNFGDNLKAELTAANKSKNVFITIFSLAVLAIPTSIILFEFFYSGSNQIYSSTVKIGLAASFAFISYFAFGQYKLYQMLTFRYKHLIGFLGGGATFISQLVDGDDTQLKSEINQKMASLFMSIDDIMGLIKRNRHPAELSADNAIKLLDKAAKVLPQNK